jgi:cell division septal protein FtsQ
MNPLRRILPRRFRAPELESVARGQRARDHLARKRERERQRLERSRNEQAIRQSRRRILGVLAPILFVAAVALGVVSARPVTETLFYSSTPLERIAVQGAHSLSPRAIAAGAGVLAGIPLDTVDPQQVRRALVTEPWIKSARALRLPTGTLVVQIVERQAVARWRIAETLLTELVDERGIRFSGAMETAGPVPLVQGEGDRTGALPFEALQILQDLRRYDSLTTRPASLILHLPAPVTIKGGVLNPDPSGYVLELGHEGPRALLGRRFLSQRVARLAALLDEDKALVQTARLIDLRYADRAVLQTEPASG